MESRLASWVQRWVQPGRDAFAGASRGSSLRGREWSGARDLNPGPHGPEPCALPNCASPRHQRGALPAARPTEGDDSTRRSGPPRS